MNISIGFGGFPNRSLNNLVCVLAFSIAASALAQSTDIPVHAATAPAPATRPFISPFSLSAVPPYFPTNLPGFATAYSDIHPVTLVLDPFSLLPYAPQVVPAVIASPEPATFEPVSPLRCEFPPGAFLKPAASYLAQPVSYADTSFMISPAVSEDTAYFNFPPGASLRRTAPQGATLVGPAGPAGPGDAAGAPGVIGETGAQETKTVGPAASNRILR